MPFSLRVHRRFVPLALVAAVVGVVIAAVPGGADAFVHDLGADAPTVVSSRLGGADRGMALTPTRDVSVRSFAIEATRGSTGGTTLQVSVREVTDGVRGPLLKSATAPLVAGVAYQTVPIDFVLREGHTYDVAFTVVGGWGSTAVRFFQFDNPALVPDQGFERGPVRVLDGGGPFGTVGVPYEYAYTLLPHVVLTEDVDLSPATVDVRVADGDATAGSGWYNAATSGSDGVTVVVNASHPTGVTGVRCVTAHDLFTAAGPTLSFVLHDGSYDVTCVATTGLGTTGASADSSAMPLHLDIDETPPVLAPRVDPDPVPAGAAASAVANADDAVSGLATGECQPPDTSTPGHHSTPCRAVDVAGNEATATAEYDVVQPFDGFFAPVRMGVDNAAKAGSAVPLKFSLGGFHGLDVVDSVTVAPCTGCAGVPATGSLRYDADADQYVYVWKTDKAWAGSHRVVTMTVHDAGSRSVTFAFS